MNPCIGVGFQGMSFQINLPQAQNDESHHQSLYIGRIHQVQFYVLSTAWQGADYNLELLLFGQVMTNITKIIDLTLSNVPS